MRVAHINLAREFRGGERQTLLLMQELAARGWAQRLVARTQSELADEVAAQLPGVEISHTRTNPLTAGKALKGCALSHAHEARGVYVALSGRLRYRIPFIVTRRVIRPQKASWLRDQAFRRAAAVVAISKAVAKNIRVRYPDIEPELIPSAHATLSVDAQVAQSIRDRYPGRTLIVHSGSYIQKTKGQLTIIDVARRAAKERPDWYFLLLGAGKDEALFRERMAGLDNIELGGFVNNIGDYMAAADLFVFPSLDEALGSSLLDAMQFGLPIVATRVGGIPEFVHDGVNGILIDPDAPDQLFAGIDRLARPSAEVDAMHLANRQRADEFRASRMAEAYEALYRQIL